MRARCLFFALAALSVFAACNPKEDTPTVKASLTVSGAKDNTIAVTEAGKTVKLTVKSNVSWEASCDAEWVEVDPSSVEVTDNKETLTKVSVVVKQNEGKEERSAKLTIGADGVDAVVITINQSAPTAEENVLCVWDMDKFEAIKDPAISAPFSAVEGNFVIHSNVSWTATSSEWIAVNPISNTYDGENQNVTVNLTIEANTTDAVREGEIKFVGEGVEDLVVVVKQAKADKVNVTLEETDHPYCDVNFSVVPDEGIMWFARYFTDDVLAQIKENNYTPGSYLVALLNYYLSKGNTSDVIISALLNDSEQVIYLTNLDEETHYQFTAIGVKYDEANAQFVATTLPTDVEFTTASAPAAEKDYAALLGTYSVNVTDKFRNTTSDVQFTVVPQYINETYYMYFPNGDFSPVDGSYVDNFILGYDSENKQIILPNVQLGSEGFTWNFDEPVGSNAGIVFYATIGENEYDENDQLVKEATVPEYLYYKWSSDYNKLTLFGTELGSEKLHWASYICKLNSGKLAWTGYVSASYIFNGSTDIVRVSNTTTSAVKEKKNMMYPEFPAKKASSFFCK